MTRLFFMRKLVNNSQYLKAYWKYVHLVTVIYFCHDYSIIPPCGALLNRFTNFHIKKIINFPKKKNGKKSVCKINFPTPSYFLVST